MSDCIFCKIVKGEAPCHKVWEDEKHLAFLSIYPNTEGFTILVTKEHYSSYIFDLPDEILKDLIMAAKKVGKLLDTKLDNVIRTGVICEGMEIDHAHIKLAPIRGIKDSGWKNDSKERVDNKELQKLAEKIKGK